MTNPFTGGSYGTAIPSGSISQIALNTLKQFYPDPNIGDPTAYTDNGVANYQANVDNSGHSDQFDVRGDQYFGANQKFLLWGKFTWKNFPINSPEDTAGSFGAEHQPEPGSEGRYKLEHQAEPDQRGGFGFTRFTSGQSEQLQRQGLDHRSRAGWVLQNLFYNGIPEMDFNHIQA